MGCSPSKDSSSIIELKNERVESKKATVSTIQDQPGKLNAFKSINGSLFIIGEENSKNEESRNLSNIGQVLYSQKSDNFKDASNIESK
ncbi:hypothetical protein SteCoe_4882 [Stentor coeruleus]|uniref:Uncharacterized protein n=1 Tax=Stentor coeruleus TaxID=5963 RepID=A0A1R2CTN4_9CILI|nr:hypothetical protein SteCoe_4882 [Stentor coeruleus]